MIKATHRAWCKGTGQALLVLLLAACTAPGQRVSDSQWYGDKGASPQIKYELNRVTPALLASLAAKPQPRGGVNTELAAAIQSYQYLVGPQDVLNFTVWDHPELTIPAGEFRAAEAQGHLVSAEGTIFFPYVGEVEVAGMTLVQIRKKVTEKLSRYIQNPQLEVRIAAFRSKKVNVTGEVSKPGTYPITDVPMTLMEALNMAGGVTETAAPQQVRVVRGEQRLTLDVQALLEHGDLSQNILLQHGDAVYVPDNSYYAVHMLGSVQRSGAVPMSRGRLNLAEAITNSGGFDETISNPGRIFVFRGPYDNPQVYWLDAKSPGGMLLATQFPMQPQDVVYVANIGLVGWNRVVGLIMPTVQGLWQTENLIDRLND